MVTPKKSEHPLNIKPGQIRSLPRTKQCTGIVDHLRLDRRSTRTTFPIDQFKAINAIAIAHNIPFTAAVRLLVTEALECRTSSSFISTELTFNTTTPPKKTVPNRQTCSPKSSNGRTPAPHIRRFNTNISAGLKPRY